MSIAHDLSDAEFDELDDLLAATPEPLEPLDASMLDGYLAGVLVQPRLIPIEEWLPPVFDYDGRPLPDDVDPAWLARVRALVERRFASLNQSMLEQGWFYPVVLDLDAEEGEDGESAEDGENAAEAAAKAEDAVAAGAEAVAEGTDPDALQLPDDPITRALLPWVGGFEYAAVTFPDLHEQADDNVNTLLARLYRHLPAETPEEKEIVETMNREHPLKNIDEAIEDLILTVVDLQAATEEQRYHVEQVRRDAPKLGRNDPCHCGSGKKFKNCHGAA
ncbi:MAG: UPF0149 family protein [Mitsuaria chitosanitabida]|uniref:UPF0149 family protein n=1 Tax=Roseateles chitosanitabidus TaxID=65048 RepID=UPI001B2CA534|nr:UPF0149 family protein [Roseateles chitosanitabidus]MBO9687999.1 UPF0149 family protein [Roseateles chitosanitabidus]